MNFFFRETVVPPPPPILEKEDLYYSPFLSDRKRRECLVRVHIFPPPNKSPLSSSPPLSPSSLLNEVSLIAGRRIELETHRFFFLFFRKRLPDLPSLPSPREKKRDDSTLLQNIGGGKRRPFPLSPPFFLCEPRAVE